MKIKYWLPFFRNELEKIAIPMMPVLMGGLTVMQTKGDITETRKQNKLEPLRQKEQSLQTPGSNQYQFEGGKRIDNQAATAANLY